MDITFCIFCFRNSAFLIKFSKVRNKIILNWITPLCKSYVKKADHFSPMNI